MKLSPDKLISQQLVNIRMVDNVFFIYSGGYCIEAKICFAFQNFVLAVPVFAMLRFQDDEVPSDLIELQAS